MELRKGVIIKYRVGTVEAPLWCGLSGLSGCIGRICDIYFNGDVLVEIIEGRTSVLGKRYITTHRYVDVTFDILHVYSESLFANVIT